MDQTGDEPAHRRTPWVVAAVVALVFAIEMAAGFVDQWHNNAQPAGPAASASTCLPAHVVEALKRSLPSASHTCVTIADAKAVGCEVTASPIPGANVVAWSTSCISLQVVSSAPFLPFAAVPSRVSPRSATLPPAKDPVVARLTAWDDYPSACVLVVKGLPPDAAVRRMGGNPAKHLPAHPDMHTGGPQTVTAVGQISGSTVLVQDNGFNCNNSKVLQRLSRGGVRVVSVYWNVYAPSVLSYAVSGEVLTTWNPLTGRRDGTRPHALDKLEAKVAGDVDAGHRGPGLLAVAAGITGTVVPSEWKPTYWVTVSSGCSCA